MKFGQLIEYKKRNICIFLNLAENEANRLVPGLFLFFEKVVCSLVSIYFDSPQLCIKWKQIV